MHDGAWALTLLTHFVTLREFALHRTTVCRHDRFARASARFLKLPADLRDMLLAILVY